MHPSSRRGPILKQNLHYQYGLRTVHLDGCVAIDAAYYGAPPGWVGRDIAVQWDADHVRLLDPTTGQLLRELRRQERGRHRFAPGDEPRRTPPSVAKLLARASQAGRHLGELCALIHHRDGIVAVRRILGLLALGKRYGAAVVEDACATALAVGLPEYRFVRRYLERRPAAPLTLRQVDPLIRELTYYRDVIARLTEGAPS